MKRRITIEAPTEVDAEKQYKIIADAMPALQSYLQWYDITRDGSSKSIRFQDWKIHETAKGNIVVKHNPAK